MDEGPAEAPATGEAPNRLPEQDVILSYFELVLMPMASCTGEHRIGDREWSKLRGGPLATIIETLPLAKQLCDGVDSQFSARQRRDEITSNEPVLELLWLAFASDVRQMGQHLGVAIRPVEELVHAVRRNEQTAYDSRIALGVIRDLRYELAARRVSSGQASPLVTNPVESPGPRAGRDEHVVGTEGKGRPPDPEKRGAAGMWSAAELADNFGLGRESVRKRLERFRKSNLTGWCQVSERGPREPEFLYGPACVDAVLKKMLEAKAARAKKPASVRMSGEMSGERPATNSLRPTDRPS